MVYHITRMNTLQFHEYVRLNLIIYYGANIKAPTTSIRINTNTGLVFNYWKVPLRITT